jgi:predicted nucleic acid-binding protein
MPKKHLKVFIDTNVWFSAFFGSPNSETLLNAHVDKNIEVVASQEVIRELIRNIKNKFPSAFRSVQDFFKSTPPIIIKDPIKTSPQVESLVHIKDRLIFQSALDAKINKFDSGELKNGNEELKVLVVAVLKDVLGGYVRSAHLAGLFPLVVETPALSLVRFSESKETGFLFIHESEGGAIIIISQGQGIVGSSSLTQNNQDEVIKVAWQMIKHYKEVVVEEILVGGSGINSGVVEGLKKSLGKEVLFIKPSVGGVDANVFQEYMIPISLLLKDPTEPADETTVNLLPPELVKKYEREKIKHQIWSLTLFVSLIVWISFFTALGVYLFLGMQLALIRQEEVLTQIPPEKAEYISQVEEINKISTKVLSVTSARVYPETIINAISKARPPGVTILRYRINMETGSIELIGTSQTREFLIEFKDSLEENIDFSLVHIPISSFEKESDLEYVANFSYLPIAGVRVK